MKLNELKNILKNESELRILLPNLESVPSHFHVTEAGVTTKNFVDCGGKIRTEKKANFQLWVASDIDHRLSTQKWLGIIEKAEALYQGQDLDVEIEFQTETISRFGLSFEASVFRLEALHTDCLAKDACGTKPEKVEVGCCTPGGGCC